MPDALPRTTKMMSSSVRGKAKSDLFPGYAFLDSCDASAESNSSGEGGEEHDDNDDEDDDNEEKSSLSDSTRDSSLNHTLKANAMPNTTAAHKPTAAGNNPKFHSTPKKPTATGQENNQEEGSQEEEEEEEEEDLSTDISADELSDFWDQENYLSEHHYEEPLDEDSARRLLSFGDDYRNYLDSLSEGPPSLQENNHDDQQQQQQRVNGEQERGSEGRRQRRTRRHHHHHHHKGAEHVAGDEDDDDASDEEAKAARTVAKYDLKRKQIENEVKTLLQKWKGKETVHRLGKLYALAKDHASLVRLVKDVSSKTTTNPESSALYTKAKDCLKKWTRLTTRIHRLLKLSQIHIDILEKLSASLKALHEMEERLNLSANLPEEEKSEVFKDCLSRLTACKTDLFSLNLRAHGLLSKLHWGAARDSGGGGDNGDGKGAVVAAAASPSLHGKYFKELLDRLMEVYAKWDETFQRLNSLVTEAPQSCPPPAASRLEPAEEEVAQTRSPSSTAKETRKRRSQLPKVRRRKNTVSSVNPIQREHDNDCGKEKGHHETGVFHRALLLGARTQVVLLLLWLLVWLHEPSCCERGLEAALKPNFGYLNGPPPI